jgi:hypothetical protein
MFGYGAIWSGLGAVLLGVGFGAQLGESAVGEIDPLYFQGPAVHPRDRGAALDPATLPGPIVSPYLQAYNWAQGHAALAAYAGGPQYPYAPDPLPAVQQVAEPQWELVIAPPEPWPAERAAAHPEIARYASYQIEEKPAAPAEEEEPRGEPQAEVRTAAQPLAVTPVLVYDK